MLGLEKVEGLEFLNNFNLANFMNSVGFYLLLMAIFFIIAMLVFAFYFFRGKEKEYKITLKFYEQINGVIQKIQEHKAREIKIPNTNITVFHVKGFKHWYMPRATKASGMNVYKYYIKPNRELVNFNLKDMSEDMSEANMNVDHTDMRFAMTNLLDIINKNYVEGKQPWYIAYKEVISMVILIFVSTIALIFILYQFQGLVAQIGDLMVRAEQILEVAQKLQGTGVVQK